MKINKVTITGADDTILTSYLVQFSEQFPFVEWGILFSESRQGQNRYPSITWREDLLNYGLPLSAHLCGAWARRILEEGNTNIINHFSTQFKRIQLNYNFGRSKKWDLIPVLNYAEQHQDRSIILQYNKSNSGVLDRFHIKGLPDNIHFLYDSSGGRGTELQQINDPFRGQYTGYSGGINPNNIETICSKIQRHKNESKVWIDMESGVRTENEFDWQKVETILALVKNHI